MCILGSFYSSGYLVFPLENSLGRMLNVRLEFTSKCRRVQRFLWSITHNVHLACTQEPFSDKSFSLGYSARNWVSSLKWPGLSMRSQPFENHGVSPQYPYNTPKIHGANPPFGNPGGFARLWQETRKPPTSSPFLFVLNTEENCQMQLSKPWQCADAVYIWLLEKWLYLSKARLPSLVLCALEYFQWAQCMWQKKLFMLAEAEGSLWHF